jgi:DNA invertase Pin-like site-specific DNA recombinase
MIMQTDSKVTACHLKRNAYLYVRQSTVRQVFENTESTKRQYALRQKAIALGWPSERVEVIDSDLGQSGASMDRQGFQKLVTEVGLGRAGIVMGLEVSRLARNSTDWHRLLEICAVTDTLILDEDGLYDPAHFNDRLLLGLKGTMSEAELHVMRARLRGGLLNKARRGELRCHLPIGLVYDSNNQVVIDPDKQVQGSLHLLFKTFSRIGTAHAVVKHFRQNSLLFPRRIHGGPDKGNLVWGPLGVRRVLLVLHNPRYAGAYAFGRGRWKRHPDGHKTRVLLPREEWQVFIRDIHSGYISWQDYERIQHQIRQSALAYGADRRHGPPREGPALLQGRVVCGICGNRMSVHYHQRGQELTPDYCCNRRRMEDGSPTCQIISGASIDAAVGKLLVEAMTPMAVEMALAVRQEIQLRLDEADRLRYQQVERARYEADCARRRYMHVDPANRLVADSLEAEWNEKLRASTDAQDNYEHQRNADRDVLDEAQQKKLFGLTQDFPAIWNDAKTPHRERKRMVGLLIDDVTLIRGKQVTAHVRYRGGATRTLNVPLPLNAWQGRKTPQHVVDLIAELLENHTDAQVVDLLNERGCVTGADDKFSIESLRWIRYSGGLKSYKKRLMEKGMITPKETVTRFGISCSTLDLWRNKGFLRSCKCNDKGDWLYYLPSDEDVNKMKTQDRISSPEISMVIGLPENLQEV